MLFFMQIGLTGIKQSIFNLLELRSCKLNRDLKIFGNLKGSLLPILQSFVEKMVELYTFRSKWQQLCLKNKYSIRKINERPYHNLIASDIHF